MEKCFLVVDKFIVKHSCSFVSRCSYIRCGTGRFDFVLLYTPTTLLGTVQGIRSMSEGNGGLLAVQMLQEDNAILGLEKVNSFLQQEPTTFHLFNH